MTQYLEHTIKRRENERGPDKKVSIWEREGEREPAHTHPHTRVWLFYWFGRWRLTLDLKGSIMRLKWGCRCTPKSAPKATIIIIIIQLKIVPPPTESTERSQSEFKAKSHRIGTYDSDKSATKSSSNGTRTAINIHIRTRWEEGGGREGGRYFTHPFCIRNGLPLFPSSSFLNDWSWEVQRQLLRIKFLECQIRIVIHQHQIGWHEAGYCFPDA